MRIKHQPHRKNGINWQLNSWSYRHVFVTKRMHQEYELKFTLFQSVIETERILQNHPESGVIWTKKKSNCICGKKISNCPKTMCFWEYESVENVYRRMSTKITITYLLIQMLYLLCLLEHMCRHQVIQCRHFHHLGFCFLNCI